MSDLRSRYDSAIRQRIAETAGRNAPPLGGGSTRDMAMAPGGGTDMRPSSGGGFEAELDAFMRQIRAQESGGNYTILGPQTRYGRPRGGYQILDSNWSAWAEEAGIPGADWRDQAAQDRVARYKFTQYYRQYGSWEAVAVAWFAGPGRAATYVKDPAAVMNLSDVLGTSVATYVQKAMNGMGKNLGQRVNHAPTGVVLGPSQSWDEASIGEAGRELAKAFGLNFGSHKRDPAENASLSGAAKNSDHLWGGAVDFTGTTEQMMAFAEYMQQFTGPDGPIRLVLDPVNHPHGTGPHVHVSWKRNNSAPLRLPSGEVVGSALQMGMPEQGAMPAGMQTQKRGAAAMIAVLRDGVGGIMESYQQTPNEQVEVKPEPTPTTGDQRPRLANVKRGVLR